MRLYIHAYFLNKIAIINQGASKNDEEGNTWTHNNAECTILRTLNGVVFVGTHIFKNSYI